MQKRSVTVIAIAGLVAVALAAYLLQRSPAILGAGANAGAGSGSGGASAAQQTASSAAPTKAAADAKGAAKGPGLGPVPVEVIELRPQRVEEELQAVGTLRSNESVVLRPEVSGRVATIGFRDGQPVRRGQLLIGLDATLNEAEVAQAQAELNLALNNLKRTDDLASKNFVSGSAQDQAAANVQVLEARLRLAQARLAKMRIVAPFDGVAGIRTVSIGDYVRDGADLVNIEDIRTLKGDFRLPERDFQQLRVGAAVEIVADALPERRYSGTVDAVNPRVDPNGRSLEVRAKLANTDGMLRPGMFARVRVIVGARDDALLAPEEAIVPLGADFYVFSVTDDVARRVRVRLGVRRDGQVELLDGVKAGDRIVTAGIRVQRDGQPVRILATRLPMPSPGGAAKETQSGAVPAKADEPAAARAALKG
jgi:membrane fusion protein (multidrug efflux system)